MDAEDVGDDCAYWENIGYCSSDNEYFNFMKVKCIGSCCPYWKNQGYCNSDSQYFNYMLVNCKKTCTECVEGKLTSVYPSRVLFY